MLKEIAEQPNVVRQLIDTWKHNAPLKPIQTIALMKNITRMEIIACGTSLHAAKVAKQIIETLCNLPVEVTAASEYIYKRNLTDEQTLSIGISQSGETADTLTALKQARAKGARIVAITNRLTSNIVRLADEVLPLDAGVEVSVAATKSYTAQLTVLLLFALQISDCLGKIAPAESEALKEELACIPQYMDTVLGALEQIKDIAEKYALSKDFIYMARGINCATAEEGALKLKEISYINATAYAAGELKHGPIALLDEQMPIVALLPPCTQTFAKMISNCEEAKARHAKIIAVTSQETQMDGAVFDDVIRLPEIKNELLTPLLYAVPLQLFAYYVALFLGREVDQPRNLAKSVTVE
jgi:glucosamine--fructose-6-phosphate aminotransferase (isomerizing)